MTLPWDCTPTPPALTAAERDEWARLLSGATLRTDGEGLVLRGEGLEVVISLWESETGPGRFDAHATAFRPGRGRVRLDGAALVAYPVESGGCGWARLTDPGGDDEPGYRHGRGPDDLVPGEEPLVAGPTARGDLVLRGLPANEAFGLASRLLVEKAAPRTATVVPIHLPEFALVGSPAEERPAPANSQVFTSPGGKVRGTVRPLRAGRVEVAFETGELELADTTVRFSLAREGSSAVTGEVALGLVREGLWEGRWEGEVRLSGPCELVFEVIPGRASDGRPGSGPTSDLP